MKSAGTIKKGEMLIFTADLVDTVTDLPAIGLADKLKCQGRYSVNGSVITDLVISETENPGTYMFKSGSSESWIPGLLLLDIKYDIPGLTPIHTETFCITIEEGITR